MCKLVFIRIVLFIVLINITASENLQLETTTEWMRKAFVVTPSSIETM
jgi:hypothetical protein